MIKLSLLLFYLRFTEGLRGYLYWSTMIVIAIVVLQFVASFVIVFVQCIPISHYWRMHEAGGCINLTAFFLSNNIFTIITDVLILALPIPSLTQIKRSRKQRLGLFTIFFLGFLSTISSCIRLYTIRVYTQSDDRIYDAAPINLWSFVEVNLGLITASAPALKVLFTSLKRRDDNYAIGASGNLRSFHLSGFRDIHSSDSRRRPSHASRLEAHLHDLTNESPDSVAPDNRKSTLAKQAGQNCWGSQTRFNRPTDDLRSLLEHGSETTQAAGGERSDSRASFEFITFPSPVALSFPAQMPQVPEIPEKSPKRQTFLSIRSSTTMPESDIDVLRRELGGNTSQMESLVETDVNTEKMLSDECGSPDSIWILTTFDVESRRTSRDMRRTQMIV